MSEAPRVAVIGVGGFGELHVKAYLQNGLVPVGVADVDGSRARMVADRYGIAYSTDDGFRLIDELQPDGVSIVTATSAHIPLTRFAVERGCRVLLEKPIAITAAELDTLPRAADELLLPGHVLRFEPRHRELRAAVLSGAIGRVLGVSASRNRPAWHARTYADVPIALLTSIHDIDLAMWMTGSRAVAVSAQGASSSGDGPCHLVFAQVTAADGSLWSIRSSWLFPDASTTSDLFEVYGTAGVASLRENGDGIVVSWPSPEEQIVAAPPAEASGLVEEVAHFIDLVAGRALVPAVSLYEAAHAIRIAEAITESSAAGGATIHLLT